MVGFQPNIIDTYEDFLAYWQSAGLVPLDKQIRLWQGSYMAKYPELLKRQIQSYEDEGLDWREVAAEKVFPKITESLPLMREARKNILAVYKPVCMKAYQKLRLDFNVTFVLYVGIGCGAGWATQYKEQAAVLIGLENIAELRWHKKERLQGLLAHEIGHLTHKAWRNGRKRFEEPQEDSFFQLYREGFAQSCEHIILGKETWHEAPNKGWVSWCQQHKSWLAREFLRRTKSGASTRDFFGSWFNIKGRKQTGYFLGHTFIQSLEKTHCMKEIAQLDIKSVKKLASQYLTSIAHTPAE